MYLILNQLQVSYFFLASLHPCQLWKYFKTNFGIGIVSLFDPLSSNMLIEDANWMSERFFNLFFHYWFINKKIKKN